MNLIDPVFDQHDLSLLHYEALRTGTMDMFMTLQRNSVAHFFADDTTVFGTNISFIKNSTILQTPYIKLKTI